VSAEVPPDGHYSVTSTAAGRHSLITLPEPRSAAGPARGPGSRPSSFYEKPVFLGLLDYTEWDVEVQNGNFG
jgi:hypothetical protein